MRIFLAPLYTLLTLFLIFLLNTKMILPAPLGKLLAPQQGVWQNAEASDENFSAQLSFPQLKGKTNVYLDNRLVPHIFAEQETDAFFVQGFIHAKFRLWQMELQTLSAAGRAAEVVGEKAIAHDKEFRRLGMPYGAEKSLKEMESDPEIKAVCDAYTAGVNAYIQTLTESTLPIEYKLMGFKPELWSNYKSALFLKYMAYDLSSRETDFEMTNAKNYFSSTDFNLLYPIYQDSLDPIIPRGTIYKTPEKPLIIPTDADSVYFNQDFVNAESLERPEAANGSNNWAVSGSKTKSGSPILANDPHLGLNLPSIWFEMQISVPAFNVYGATFPGAPYVIIGYNDSCAFGFTNGGRDVRDYYEIKFKDDSRKEYWYDSAWKQTEFRIEEIKVANAATVYDTVAYTVFGPVMYDKNFGGKRTENKKNYAVRWTAHDSSNELLVFQGLNRAKNYADYQAAAVHLHTPGQNIVFASKAGDIALRTQGDFPAKWKGQGDFIMPGTDSRYAWQYMIPQDEVPFQFNPQRGFVSSANQRPTDSTYPYYLGRDYPTPRGLLINRLLSADSNITAKDMQDLQLNNYNVFAEMARPIFLKNINKSNLSAEENNYFSLLQNWDLNADKNSEGATVFEIVWAEFRKAIYNDEYAKAPRVIIQPFESTLVEAILRDSTYKFIDDINTPEIETLQQQTTKAMIAATVQLQKIKKENRLAWGMYKQTQIYHLTKLPAFSSDILDVNGSGFSINANKMNIEKQAAHGPSWRMVVSLTPQTEAYGVYPGGQSGNPGSRFYKNFINTWVAGDYFPLWMMTAAENKDKRVLGSISFQPKK